MRLARATEFLHQPTFTPDAIQRRIKRHRLQQALIAVISTAAAVGLPTVSPVGPLLTGLYVVLIVAVGFALLLDQTQMIQALMPADPSASQYVDELARIDPSIANAVEAWKQQRTGPLIGHDVNRVSRYMTAKFDLPTLRSQCAPSNSDSAAA